MISIKQIILLSSFIILSPFVKAQELDSLYMSTEDEKTFYQGYWKYVNADNDEVFILKIKCLDRSEAYYMQGISHYNYYIATFLYYKNGAIVSDKLSSLTRFLNLIDYSDFEQIIHSEGYGSIADIVFQCSYNQTNNLKLAFSDPINTNTLGYAFLSVLSINSGQEQIRWRLSLEDEVYVVLDEDITDEEFEQMYCTFSVPTNIVLTKMYNLREFRNKGIILEPIPELHQ